ncbi:HD domain-containing phosphohydrolase [Crateriforma conspicua]|uniref:Cyclic di-GMP phosphodiesterase response regulator RpfG n=1 Tax=Crateriforma conspicua TaxID=2527996 RepID=A0A5C5Y3U6_9PLAN|nr:HD domain-containing phosphohydrolase [Crateriforma conspicua]QDV64088.1 Cyclic di-GMP phosphodiesterase response regulator RpfG [Crateriforma conspicua]TWT69479.1 Cyclic di-GMP phosphodiesterase response regulator RpfG [Crateriforma conspicua]
MSTSTITESNMAAAMMPAAVSNGSIEMPHVDDLLIEHAPRDACVMIVDDEEINVDVVQTYLEDEGFTNFVTTTDSRDVINQAHTHSPDLVLLDINMPHVNGLQILRSMRMDPKLKRIPTVVLTAETAGDTKLMALRLGATDFLAKPVDPSELILRIENVLAAKVYSDFLQDYSNSLEHQVRERTADLERSRLEAIQCLARAAEYRDDMTGRHVMRVGRYSAIIAKALGFTEDQLRDLELAAQLHDLGKIGISDTILNKPGKLTDEEYDVIKTHCQIGVQIIKPIEHDGSSEAATIQHAMSGGTTSPVLDLASVIAATHHEKWNGRGYPYGLRGEDIPIEGRIVAVADVFDALTSKRSYKDALTPVESIKILEEGRGEHFDPAVLDAFLASGKLIMEAWRNLRDQD